MQGEPAGDSRADGAPDAALPDGAHAPFPGPLSRIPLFSHLDTAVQEELFRSMKVEKVEANKIVFWVGDEGESFYLVNEGEVAISVPNEKGEEVLLERQGPGGFFGEISLLASDPRSATARATEATELYRLDQADFHAFLHRRPDAAIDILTVMGRRQRLTTTALRHLKNPNVEFARTRLTLWQKASDVIATVSAGATFTLFHVAWFGGWIVINLLAGWGALPKELGFDPYPFGLLTMVVSLEAIFLSTFVMVSQNRQAERDRLHLDLDYQVNLKAETEITSLARRLDRLEKHLLGGSGEKLPVT